MRNYRITNRRSTRDFYRFYDMVSTAQLLRFWMMAIEKFTEDKDSEQEVSGSLLFEINQLSQIGRN